MPGHLRRHTLPATQPGCDDLPGVLPVPLRAGRADGGPPIPARPIDHPVRRLVQLPGHRLQLTGHLVCAQDRLSQPHRPHTAAGRHGPSEPPSEVRSADPTNQLSSVVRVIARSSDTRAMPTRRLARWLPLILASLALTVTGAVLIFTGHIAPGAALLAIAQPINVLIVLRSRAASADHLGTQRPPK